MSKFQYKKAAAIMVWFKDSRGSKVLMLTKRRLACKTFPGWYAAVGGSVEDGECAILSAQREMREETGFYLSKDDLKLIDCYVKEDLKCFIFETEIGMYRFNEIKNTEPKKHSPWKLYSPEEALKLPNLMPALREILLTNPQV
jgi:8-oxo-dGTP pyrophosphatase MutT (NUDIX family)